jgi:signal transduction histidine kinase/ligand-binding sensor domain-containing protein
VKNLPFGLFFFIAFSSISAWAQTYHFEKITEQNGLSDNRVTCFLKDRTGFMWIGTENGLNRYDGFTFKIYRPGQRARELSHEHINDIEEDAQGRLWISTWYGLNILDPRSDSLYALLPAEDPYQQKKTTIASSLAWDSYIDKTQKVWLALDVRDLCYYDPTVKEFSYFPWREFVKTVLPQYASLYKSILKITRKSDHQLWLGTTLGLFSFNIATKTFQYHGGDINFDLVGMYYDSTRQRVYFGQQKLYMYDVRQDKLLPIKQNPLQSDQQAASSLYLPSLSGLWSVNENTDHASLIPLDEKGLSTFEHKKVSAVFTDNLITWVGTSSGICVYDRYLDIFRFVPVFSDTSQSGNSSVYYVMDQEAENAFYVSSSARNSLIILNKKTGVYQEIFKIQGKPLRKCTKIMEDSKDRLWVLSEQSIFISDEHHKNFKIFPFPTVSDYYQFVDMMEDAEGNFWFASLRDGIYYYNANKNSWRLLKKETDGLYASRPKALLLDSIHEALWIADFGYGAVRQDIKTKKFIHYGTSTKSITALKSDLANALTIDKQGDIWIATTSGGVSKYSQNKKAFTTYSMKTGLPENTIHAIQGDLHGTIWLASNKGLTNIDSAGEIIRHYDKNSGLQFSNFSTPFSTNSKGEIFIGVANGFLKFHPDRLVVPSGNFPVVITSVQQGDRLLNAYSKQKFSYRENEFIFQFAALTYSLPKQVTYFYQLKGYDADWIDAGNNHSIRYTNLDNGDYTFLVRAVDHSGKQSSNVASISFAITPPFWLQGWFIALTLFIAISSLYFWIRSLQRKIRSQKILNQLATSLLNQHTIDDVCWAIAKNCKDQFHFEDCVVYHFQEDRNVLIQKAAAGPKSTEAYQLHNPIEIKLGQGIVGTVAQTGKAEIIADTRRDKRYIVDDQVRLSEITVPIFVEGKIFGVIDSEHRKKNYYNRWHLRMLTEIASLCSVKIGRYFIEEQIRSKVARDLHDDMGSTLSSIKIMSNIALEKNDLSTTQTYLKTIQQNANSMQESMSDMVWAINPENDTLEQVIVRMKEFAAEILEPLDIHYEFLEKDDFSHTKMDLNTKKDFFLIFKEAVNNAAKYSQCKNFTVELKRDAQGILLHIRDDGKGFNVAASNGGNGLKNMKHRANTINATIHIESIHGEGTSIRLKMPIT